jgi:hypothetical protein
LINPVFKEKDSPVEQSKETTTETDNVTSRNYELKVAIIKADRELDEITKECDELVIRNQQLENTLLKAVEKNQLQIHQLSLKLESAVKERDSFDVRNKQLENALARSAFMLDETAKERDGLSVSSKKMKASSIKPVEVEKESENAVAKPIQEIKPVQKKKENGIAKRIVHFEASPAKPAQEIKPGNRNPLRTLKRSIGNPSPQVIQMREKANLGEEICDLSGCKK